MAAMASTVALSSVALRAATYYVEGATGSDQTTGAADQPWQTLAKAGRTAQAGDTVVVREGVYREQLPVRNAGEDGKPITFRADKGARVVITGADKIAGWGKCAQDEAEGNPNFAKIRTTKIDWVPGDLYEGGRKLELARHPNEGWWFPEGGTTDTFVDSANLTQPAGHWDGWGVAFLFGAGGGIRHHHVAAYDAAKHQIRMSGPIYRDHRVEPPRDKYYLENHVTTLDGPGQYVVKEDGGGGCRLWVWPFNDAEKIEGARRTRPVIEFTKQNYLVFDELEVCYGKGVGIGTTYGETTGITIQNCYVHDNGMYGINPRSPSHTAIRRCVVSGNGTGIVIGGAQDCVVEECDIGHNRVDGLVAPGGTRNLTIRRNYIHDHALWGHPDNLQFWSDVGPVLIEDNVLMHSGQSMMSEGMHDITLRNNLVVGGNACSLICGGERFTLENNTVFCGGLTLLNLGGTHFTLRGNILAPNKATPAFGIRQRERFASDYNLFWMIDGYDGIIASVEKQWPRPALKAYQEASGLDQHSVYARPRFVNAPVYFQTMDHRRVADNTKSRFHLYGGVTHFAKGDHVEVNFDGVVRTVVVVTKEYLEVDPPLRRLLDKEGCVANWGKNDDFTWDLRLADDSPARGAGPNGSNIGSSLDVRQYMAGDFDGDGERDLPAIPKGHYGG